MLTVTLHLKKSQHLNQYIYGFLMLQRTGVLKIKSINHDDSLKKHILRANINGLKIVYDAEDGDHFERGFFSQSDYEWCDFYYKRSCSESLLIKYPKCRPLTFNYSLTPSYSKIDYLNQNFRRLMGKGDIRHYDLEVTPFYSSQPKILFITGLWDPMESHDPEVQREFEEITMKRVSILKTLKRHYSHCATFGVNGDRDFTRRVAGEFILPKRLTTRPQFISMMKSHDICITTNGLHNSIGWRFGEFVASSRAIISEKLHYKVPGCFSKGVNYLSFNSEDSLLKSLSCLLENHDMRLSMMLENQNYYKNHVRPDILIMNTIIESGV